MVSVMGLLQILILIVLQTAIAALLVRFIRVRLETRWGAFVFVLLLVPIVLTLSTYLFSGLLGLGSDVGSRRTAVYVVIVLPVALGLTIDYVWMPSPDEVELPDAED